MSHTNDIAVIAAHGSAYLVYLAFERHYRVVGRRLGPKFETAPAPRRPRLRGPNSTSERTAPEKICRSGSWNTRPTRDARCASCHGATGGRELGGRSLRSAEVQRQSEGEIARVIREGRTPASAAAHRKIALTNEELNAVAAYVKALD